MTEIDPPYFRTVSAPSAAELQALAQTISERIGRHLERTGKLVRDEESSYLALESEGEDALQDLQGHSIRYRIAVGPHKGRKAFMLQSLPPLTGERTGEPVPKVADFSLHAGVAADVHQRQKLERLCRYITRPPVAIERLSLTPQGSIRYSLKTPYRDGTTHVIVEPLDFIARLASLVPSPRVNLTRFRGVFIQGAVNLQGVTAFGTGTITSAVNNTGATIQGGSSGVAGTLTINCSLTQGSGGTIQELISGRSAGQFSQILVNGVVGLGGALDVVAATAAGIGVPAMKDPTEQRGLHSTCRSVNMKADSRFELSQSAVAPAPRCRECEH